MTTPAQARKYASGLVSASISASMLRSLSDQVEALTKERDALALVVDQWIVDFHELRLERDALMSAADSHKVVRDTLTARLNVLEAAAKLALDALEDCRDVLYQVAHGNQACSDAEGVGSTLPDVFEALKKAGVQ